MRARLQLVILLITIPASAWTADIPGLEKLWELKFSDVCGESGSQSTDEMAVFRLSFSRDGRQVAAVVGQSTSAQFALILDSADPRKECRRLNFNSPLPESKVVDWLSWSLSGQHIILGNTLVCVSDGTACNFFHYTIPHFFVADRVTASGLRSPIFLGLDCQLQPTEPWQISSFRDTLDVSTERGLVCTKQWVSERWSQHEKRWKPSSKGQACIDIIDINARVLVRRFPADDYPETPLVRFADNGKVVCEQFSPLLSKSKVRCWEIDSGKQIAEIAAGGDIDLGAAYRARRLVTSNYFWIRAWIPLPEYYPGRTPNPKRDVWDLRSGKRLVSWQSRSQNVIIPGQKKLKNLAWEVAISPDGEYICEGGAGVLTFYRIKP